MRTYIAGISTAAAIAVVLSSGCGGGGALNGCSSNAFVDQRGAGAVMVSFGGQNGSPLYGYSPACLAINAQQTVTFQGAFVQHPLSPGSSPSATNTGSPNNPIPATSTGTSLAVPFPTAGTYPFFCQFHYASNGMTGVVQVH